MFSSGKKFYLTKERYIVSPKANPTEYTHFHAGIGTPNHRLDMLDEPQKWVFSLLAPHLLCDQS